MIYGKSFSEKICPYLVFAWLPKTLDNGQKAWLEYVWYLPKSEIYTKVRK